MRARRNKAQAESPWPHQLRLSEPTGMGALASRFQKAGGREGNGRRPGGTLVLSAAAMP